MYSVLVAIFFSFFFACFGLSIPLDKGHYWGYHWRFLSDLPLPWDYHNLMLIEVVTAMNTNVEEKCGTAIFRSASAWGALQVIKGSFLFLFVPISGARPPTTQKTRLLCLVLKHLICLTRWNLTLFCFFSLINRPTSGISFCWSIQTKSCPSIPLW